MSPWKIIIQIHNFFVKSDILTIHLTNLIHRIGDNINSLNVNINIKHLFKMQKYLWKISM